MDFDEFLDISLQVLREHILAYQAKQTTGDLELSLHRACERSSHHELRSSHLERGVSHSGSGGDESVVLMPEDVLQVKEAAYAKVNGRSSKKSERETPGETPGLCHGESTILTSTLSEMNEDEKRAIRHRLRARLGHVTPNKLVSGKSLHEAVCALGLTRYSEEDMNTMVNHVASFVGLSFQDPEDTWSGSIASFTGLAWKQAGSLGIPVWEWPKEGHVSHTVSARSLAEKGPKALAAWNVVPLAALMDVFLAKEGDMVKKIFGKQLLRQFQAVKEILLAGDTNRLVAELTCVRINDLAAPPEPIPALAYLEPFVALLILVNGVVMGFQTDPNYETWSGWVYFELGFAIALVLELSFRLLLVGCRDFWRGPDRRWNHLDSFLSVAAWADVLIQFAWSDSPEVMGTFLLRYLRLVRMARIVKIFRLTFMKDLRLMMRGLIAGVWTLALAFVLLFTVMYVIAGTATITLDSRSLAEIGLESYFYNIPTTMFTAFRCFSGDCVDHGGHSVSSKLTEAFGVPFVLGYVASYMLVNMGIFNVILAVYVEITMRSAKESDEQYNLESIKVARATRELLKKFAAAHHVFHILGDHTAELSQLEISYAATLFSDDEIEDNIEISKELFLLVIHDRKVQALMDDLDLPANRAHLFEVIDADGSGTLHIQELLQGLLKLRGEVNKGDVVAPLLATKSVQEMVNALRTDQNVNFERIHREMMLAAYQPVQPFYVPKLRPSKLEDPTPSSTKTGPPSKLQLPVTHKPELMLPPETAPSFA